MRAALRMSLRIMRMIPRAAFVLRAPAIGTQERTYPSRAHEPEGRVAQAGGRSPTKEGENACIRAMLSPEGAILRQISFGSNKN